VNGQPSRLPIDLLALTRMKTETDIQPEVLDRTENRRRGHECASGLRERRLETVACRVLFPTLPPLQLLPDNRSKPRQHDLPAGITQVGRDRRRPDDVEEEHRRDAPPGPR